MKKIIQVIVAILMIGIFHQVGDSQYVFAQGSSNPSANPAPAPIVAPVSPAPAPSTTTLTPGKSTPGSFYTGGLYTNSDPARYSINGLVNTLLPGAAKWIASALGAIAVIFLIWAGIQFLTAEGEPDKIGMAIKTAFYVIAGVLLVMFASALVYLFLTIFTPTT